MTHRFTLIADTAWCANCGTVSTDGECDCTRGYAPCKPDWKPYDGRAMEFVEKLRAENKALRKAAAPFAAIKPSSFFPADGSENEGYVIYTCSSWKDRVSFTGKDLANLRAASKVEGGE